MKDKSIFIKNLYYMLAYVYEDLSRFEDAHVEIEKFEDALNLLTAMLCKLVSRLVKRGLIKDYIKASNDLNKIKGRIEIDKTIRLKSNLKNQVACSYENLSVDNYLNRIIKTTMHYLLLSKDLSNNNKKLLKKLLAAFNDVSMLEKSSFRKINYNRQNIHYRTAINLCSLIMEDMIISTEPGDYRAELFLSDRKMHSIYEKFVLNYYKKHYPNLKPSSSRIRWNLDDNKDTMLPVMITDITLTYKQRSLIIDTKYYSSVVNKNSLYDSQALHSSNLYQIFTYVKNKDVEHSGNVIGVILYAKTDENVDIENEYNMSGNKIFVKTLDLNREFSFIKDSLDSIAEILIADSF